MPSLPPAPVEQPNGNLEATPQQLAQTPPAGAGSFHDAQDQETSDNAAEAWQPPAPVPISESQNPDAIALRAAISILQTQRDRATADLQLLESVKQRAVQSPEEFLEAAGIQAAKQGEQQQSNGMDVDADEGESDTSSENGEDEDERFPSLPTAQNVVRCPPVNWAKYHILPEPLERLHAVQQMRPDSGLPYNVVQPGLPPGISSSGINGADGKAPSRPPTVAAPYSPFLDGRLEGMQTRNQGRRKEK